MRTLSHERIVLDDSFPQTFVPRPFAYSLAIVPAYFCVIHLNSITKKWINQIDVSHLLTVVGSGFWSCDFVKHA